MVELKSDYKGSYIHPLHHSDWGKLRHRLTRTFPIGGREITLNDQIFGVLAEGEDWTDENPYTRVSIAGSSFSLDPYKGCPCQCRYCTAAGDMVNWRATSLHSHLDSFANLIETTPTRLFRGEALAEALVRHPGFIANKSIVGIGLASTESFMPHIEEETWAIMKYLANNGYRNPIWIVTKLGIPDALLPKWLERFTYLTEELKIPIIVSVSDSGLDQTIEPITVDRFKHAQAMREAGVKVCHHFRPIVPGRNDTVENVKKSLQRSLGVVDAITVGGVRPTGSMDFVSTVDGIPELIPEGYVESRDKLLTEGFTDLVKEEVARRGFNTSVFSTSSETLSSLLGVSDYALHRYRQHDSFLHIPANIVREVEIKNKKNLRTLILEIASNLQLEDILDTVLRIAKKDGFYDIFVSDPWGLIKYQEETCLLHAIGHAELFP